MISNPGKKLKIICSLAILFAIALMPFVGMDDALAQDTNGDKSSNPYLVGTFVDEQGRLIDEVIVPGRPPEIKAAVATVPESNPATGTNILPNVPAFDWSYGCSATSAAMLFGYYDNTGYPNMYTGPTNGGFCPMDNSVWGPGIGGSQGECPLSATHQGIDGRITKGHVDDYWVGYGSTAPDPFIGNWTEHTHGDCTGDFMGTSQSNFGNSDGATAFYFSPTGDPLYDYTGCQPDNRDGCHGLRLFAKSRGYSVVKNFSQYIYGQAPFKKDNGFTFSDFQFEIDDGRPVLIQIEGHTMLGYGYNTAGQIVYIYDTWDHNTHQMTWGGTYEGLQHYAVTVIQLEPAPGANNPPNVPSNPSPANRATGVSINDDFSWTGGDPDPGDTVIYDVYFGTSVTPPLVSDDQTGTTYNPGTLSYDTKYYWRVIAKDNHAASTTGPQWDFTTESPPNDPPQLSSPSVEPPSGIPSTNFYYQVNYYDSDGDSPSVKKVYVDDIAYAMSLYSGSASNGIYRCGPKNLSVGNHNYYFYFEDGKGGVVRLPISDSYSGPTVSAANNSPNMPSNPFPPNHGIGFSTSTGLRWTGGDLDVGDTITYDVYFGTTTTPSFSETIGPCPATQSSIIYDPGTLSYNTKYYWKIIARDNHEASTTGPLWDFTTAGPRIAFSPSSFSFSATEGGANPPDKTLEVWNSGAGTLNWSAADSAAWLSLSLDSGSSTGEPDVLTLSIDMSGMVAGSYSATIIISAPGATNSPQIVPVNLEISSTNATTASRSLPASVKPVANFDVDISASGCGFGGQVVETIPDGFTYVSCPICEDPASNVGLWSLVGNVATFVIIGDAADFTYTVTAPATEGTYYFAGVVLDEDRNDFTVGGDIEITVWDPWVYDENPKDGIIQKDEAIKAVQDYFGGKISKMQAIEVVMLYFSSRD